MTGSEEFSVRFWGVRGSIACPGPDTVRYGGNTTCIEIRCGDQRVIIDGGTGLRNLGNELLKEKPSRIDIFFTHTHWDHIAGIPFFLPAYSRDIEVHFWAGHLLPDRTLKRVLCYQMLEPLFPVPIEVFNECYYHDFRCGEPMTPWPEVRLDTGPLNHPNGACGYRVSYRGKSICVITDTEHRPGERDAAIVELVRGADVMIYDSMYTEAEYARHVGWGHSTWEEALRVGDAAEVRQVVLFHHEPGHDDAFMDGIAAKAAALRPGTVVAREGLVLRP